MSKPISLLLLSTFTWANIKEWAYNVSWEEFGGMVGRRAPHHPALKHKPRNVHWPKH